VCIPFNETELSILLPARLRKSSFIGIHQFTENAVPDSISTLGQLVRLLRTPLRESKVFAIIQPVHSMVVLCSSKQKSNKTMIGGAILLAPLVPIFATLCSFCSPLLLNDRSHSHVHMLPRQLLFKWHGLSPKRYASCCSIALPCGHCPRLKTVCVYKRLRFANADIASQQSNSFTDLKADRPLNGMHA
jgi:hypothetical protein